MKTQDKIKDEILSQLPSKWQRVLKDISFKALLEIRFRLSKQVMLYYDTHSERIDDTCNKTDLDEIFLCLCKNSVYAYSEHIASGFITIDGGHRVGIAGRCKISDGKINTINAISGLNIRIAKDAGFPAEKVIHYIKDGSGIKNTLIISPPLAGKTTLLRAICKKLSEENKCCVVDERSEICGFSENGDSFDVGAQTDVLDSCPKREGIMLALRSLSPDVVITDEIDTDEDIHTIKKLIGRGVKIITSAHSESSESFIKNHREFLELFDVLIELGRKNGVGTIENIRRVCDI